jgi:hypothetical protein
MIQIANKYKIISIGLILILNLSCITKENQKEEFRKNPAEIPLVIQRLKIEPNKQINKTIDTWNAYFENKKNVNEIRQNFNAFQENTYPRIDQSTPENEMKQLTDNEILRFSFDEIDNKFSKVGVYVDTGNKRDTIIQLEIVINLGKYLNSQNHSLWIIKEIEYTLKHKENIKIKPIFDLSYNFNRDLNDNEIQQTFSLGLRIGGFKYKAETFPTYCLFYQPSFKMAEGKIKKSYLLPLDYNLQEVNNWFADVLNRIFLTNGIYKVEIEGDIKYWQE